LACSLLASIISIFSKEFGVLALPILFFAQRFLIEEKNLRREIESYVPYGAVLAFYFMLRGTVVSSPFVLPDDLGTRLAFAPYVIGYHLKLILLPAGLHSFSIDYPSFLLSVPVLLSYLSLAGLVVLCCVLRKEPLFLFASAAFLTALLPILNLVSKASVSLVAMRWLYLPMVFIALIGCLLVERVQSSSWRRLIRPVLAAVVLYLGTYSFLLNTSLWHDERTFLSQEVLHFQNDVHRGDYAELLLKEKRYGEAEIQFQRAAAQYPDNARILINYGALLIETSRPQEALAVLEQARGKTMVTREVVDWHINLGVALGFLGSYEAAEGHLKEALALDPENRVLHRNLAALYARQERHAEALHHMRFAGRPEPLHKGQKP